ncbi:AFG1/ZapE family ATPase [Arthrobacter cavernae]|uniref:AFG1/ZapE family ATPase n=1 Tax=Arthrobacter cavernae TaxID=2817681 RepID=UPI001F60E552|nr:AFG1/ZapE family ATPase [Arthrobacter cavernae]
MTAARRPQEQTRGAEPALGFRTGRIITPGSPRQLGRLGLFPPSDTQRRILTPTTRPITARNAEPDLLWISFAELCGGPSTEADFRALAAEYRMWVIDGVPSPQLAQALGPAADWERFSKVVEVLHEQDIALFLIGAGPFDWGTAGTDTAGTGAGLPAEMVRTASRLALLGRIESPDASELPGEIGIAEGAGS